ncbi:hypothetical protein SNEBB_008469 [Seison nebaliae]|nr:hypothetical protein SNEBB_008469 [Seison nebaliae]
MHSVKFVHLFFFDNFFTYISHFFFSKICLLFRIIMVNTRPLQTDDIGITQKTFKDYKELDTKLVRNLYDMEWMKPSIIQENTFPTIFKGRNVIARAKNGVGKTGAYLIPLLNGIDVTRRCIQGIVLVPTRELALQTSQLALRISHKMDIKVMVTTGGTNLTDDILRAEEIVHVVVATPGRLLDLAKRQILNLTQCKMVVLDEADRLLHVHFEKIISGLFAQLEGHVETQILMFSATFPLAINGFITKHVHHIEKINCMDQLLLAGMTQYYAYVEEKTKIQCLYTLFNRLKMNQSIIFCNSTRRVELLAKRLKNLNFSVYYIHSRMNQQDRNNVFHQFRLGRCRHLVCSDLFARGIDNQNVNVVFNFDFPHTTDVYLHRIGRGGRYGHLSLAVNLLTIDDKDTFIRMRKEINGDIGPIPMKIDERLYVKSAIVIDPEDQQLRRLELETIKKLRYSRIDELIEETELIKGESGATAKNDDDYQKVDVVEQSESKISSKILSTENDKWPQKEINKENEKENDIENIQQTFVKLQV